jgi:predicted SAM-dependent methyltransferase
MGVLRRDQAMDRTAERGLHIGGKVVRAGWEILDAIPNPWVDHVGDAADLSRFGDESFDAVYASHVIEHFDYSRKLAETLREWRRVLKPGGLLYLSAPDLDILARLFVSRDKFTVEERFALMRMMFGGHIDPWDYHMVGLNEEFLASYLLGCGYTALRRADSFGLFEDTSTLRFRGVPISVNIVAQKAADVAPAGPAP